VLSCKKLITMYAAVQQGNQPVFELIIRTSW
jgi:hypothetical protein